MLIVTQCSAEGEYKSEVKVTENFNYILSLYNNTNIERIVLLPTHEIRTYRYVQFHPFLILGVAIEVG